MPSREDWIQMLLCKRVAGHSLGMEILSCLEHLALGCKVLMDPPSVRLTKMISFDFFPPYKIQQGSNLCSMFDYFVAHFPFL